MSLKCITIEVRKNLYCANVYLQFDHSLTETEFVKINVANTSIKLREYSTETSIPLDGHFTVQAQSLSSLVVEENNASFRMSIDTLPAESVWAKPIDSENRVSKIVPETEPSSELKLECCSCQNRITREGLKIDRILEFPSGSIDVGEFFCHHGPDLNSLLVPRLNDMFYGFYYVVLNADAFTGIRIKEKHAYCRRCLRHFGETLLNDKALKIWTDTLKQPIFKQIDTESMVTQLMAKILEECSVSNELHIMQFSKAIVEATLPTRRKKYILLNILEKNLDILRNTTASADGLNNNVGQVKLAKCKANKVLFQFHENEDNPLLCSWRADISVHTKRISPTLFAAFLRRLEENSQLLPELYRYSNEFVLSYVFY